MDGFWKLHSSKLINGGRSGGWTRLIWVKRGWEVESRVEIGEGGGVIVRLCGGEKDEWKREEGQKGM